MTFSPLKIQLHLTNGSTHRFVQRDPQNIESVLQSISPRVFAQSNLIFCGAQSVTTYPTAALVGITLSMEPMPESLLRLTRSLPNGVGEIREISQADYQMKLPQLQSFVTGQSGVSLNEIEFTSGHRLWLEVQVQSASHEMQERQLVKHAFEGMGLICRSVDGVVSLWNRANMVSYRFNPGPEAPQTALPAEPVTS